MSASDQQQARTWAPHDCYAWNVQHYNNHAEYSMVTCGTCGRVTGFCWRSPWRRLKSWLLGSPGDPR